MERQSIKGRGAQINPPNRFESTHSEDDFEQIEDDEEFFARLRKVPTQYLPDATQSILVSNDSPDIPFRYSINPYRGCAHGCAYCYARPYHEYLGMNAGLDFETRIMVKHDAARLLRAELNRPGWSAGETIAISGVTDCYQPAERKFRITRGLLEVLLEARQPCGLITKNVLVLRDKDLLSEMARQRLVHVFVSITTLDAELARTMEPRTATPAARLRAIAELSAAGVPVGAMVAPLIPGLNDDEAPAILAAVREAGALTAGFTLLRLPLAVEPIFLDWIARAYPLKAARVESLIRNTRDGQISDAQFGRRMRGQGPYAKQIETTFKVFRKKHGLDKRLPSLDTSQFRPPAAPSGQRSLF
ncbi:MAG: PA0069 family radical SAM protein [Planctomycetia bacterium]|nr:PA0069 family radical SAM protein [Planctomycetia bacterium]